MTEQFDWDALTYTPSTEELAREEAAAAQARRLLSPCAGCGHVGGLADVDGRLVCRRCESEAVS